MGRRLYMPLLDYKWCPIPAHLQIPQTLRKLHATTLIVVARLLSDTDTDAEHCSAASKFVA